MHSDYIKCKENTYYSYTHICSGLQIAYYNSNKEYISGVLRDNNPNFTDYLIYTPTNCNYFRITLYTVDLNNFAIYELDHIPTINDLARELKQNRYINNYNIKYNSLTIDKMNFVNKVYSDNLFNYQTDVYSSNAFVSYTSGELAYNSNSEYSITDYIEIKSSTTYSIYGANISGRQIAFYDNSKEFISGLLDTYTAFISPENAKYIRFTLRTSTIEQTSLVEGSTAYFVPYSENYIIDKKYIDISSVNAIITVGQDENCNFSSVSEAVNNAKNGDTIFVKAGIYNNEVIRARNKTITIIGEDKYRTIIQNGYSTYSKPPIEFSSGRLSNLTFYAYDSGSVSTDANGWPAYANHIDHDSQDGNILNIDNCIFKSDKNYSIGIGLRRGHLYFNNCMFWSRDTAPIFFHDSTNTTNAGDEYITFKNCIAESETNSVMRIDSQKTLGNNVYVEFINNIFISKITDNPTISFNNMDNTNGTSTTIGTFNGLINFYKVKTSMNNNLVALNY